MKAFLLAAGFGERLRPLTDSVPKSLVPVAGLPVICYALAMLKEAGVAEIMCNTHYRAGDIVRFFERNDHFGMDISFSHEEVILGTGGGLKKCEAYFSDDDFIIINSDIICDLDLTRVIGAHRTDGHPGTIVLYPWNEKGPAPVAVDRGRVVDFKKALGSPVIPAWDYMGMAVLSPAIFPYLSPEFSSVVYTGYTSLVTHHSLGYVVHDSLWQDMGTPESLASADRLLLSERKDLPERVRQVLGAVR